MIIITEDVIQELENIAEWYINAQIKTNIPAQNVNRNRSVLSDFINSIRTYYRAKE